MKRRLLRALLPVALILGCLLPPAGPLWAQNENETVGFQSNHIFESGQFGENIDVLNGGLSLTIPIGPRYQVNSRLGYGLNLSYSSKVWDTSGSGKEDIVPSDQVLPYNESPFGAGFSMHFGRIFSDALRSNKCEWNQLACWLRSWKWVSPDGNQHEFHFATGDPQMAPPTSPPFTFNQRSTSDQSYALITGPDDNYCFPETERQCYHVETPDGLIYTLAKRSSCADPLANQDDALDPRKRSEYLSFCGWYTTLIEDPSVGQRQLVTVNEGGTTLTEIRQPYPNHVKITYDSRPKFEHLIATIEDSATRRITFHNCEVRLGANPLTGGVDPDADTGCIPGSEQQTYVGTDRHATATYKVDVPAFGNKTTIDGTVATYRFNYEYNTVKRGNLEFDIPNLAYTTPDPKVLELLRIDYPEYFRSGETNPQRYSQYFGYQNVYSNDQGNGDYGEVTCRTLPVLRSANGQSLITGNPCDLALPGVVKFTYAHFYYRYVAAYLTGGMVPSKPGLDWRTNPPTGGGSPLGLVSTGFTRNIVRKGVLILGQTTPWEWRYDRGDPTRLTNPSRVVVTDPFGNDTVYLFHASADSGDPNNGGSDPEDGFAPEWRDGMGYQTDYYEGSASAGRLVRTVLQAYDADPQPSHSSRHTKDNIRVQRETTRHMDQDGRESVVTRNDWDGFGHWKTETQSGFGVTLPRTTRNEYLRLRTFNGAQPTFYKTDLVRVGEVSDGTRVLSRTDSDYNAGQVTGVPLGALLTRIERVTPPGGIASPWDLTHRFGDQKTTYEYSAASGNVLRKKLWTDPASANPAYNIKYTYAPASATCLQAGECGGYLATKQFFNPDGSLPQSPWLAIDRTRDGNTGLTMATRDSAKVQTDFLYDALGRVTEIRPSGEEVTQIDYVSLTETTVTRGYRGSADDLGVGDFIFTRYLYDGLGRQVVTQRRPADPSRGFACQRTQYDIANHATYTTEWAYLSAAACTPLPILPPGSCAAAGVNFSNIPGTEIDFRDPDAGLCDPFGRQRRVIPADADRQSGTRITTNVYTGTTTRVDVNGVRGPGQAPFNAVTTSTRDALGRLIIVDASPAGQFCSVSGAACSSSTPCAAGSGTCVAADGGADALYTYDALDRLERVELTDNLTQNQVRRFAYDGLGRLLWAENPESGTTVYKTYDALGNLLEVQDAAGNLQKFAFDYAGRLLKQAIVPRGGTEKTTALNTYDENASPTNFSLGKITTIESRDEQDQPLLRERRSYGGLGGRLSETVHEFLDWPAGVTEKTSYSYDYQGQVSAITYPREIPANRSVSKITYSYANGLVVSLTADYYVNAINVSRVTYNAAAAVETLETPGGGRTIMTFDARNRPRTITAGQMGSTTWGRKDFESGAYEYDGAGNIYQIGASKYGYDSASRLVTAHTVQVDDLGNQSVYDEEFSYDIFGNMAQRRLKTNGTNEETDTFTVQAPLTAPRNQILNRQTVIGSTPATAVNFYYDPNGNLIEGGRRWQIGASAVEDLQRYEYGTLNRLLKVHQMSTAADGMRLAERDEFAYDASGNRISKLEPAAGLKTYS